MSAFRPRRGFSLGTVIAALVAGVAVVLVTALLLLVRYESRQSALRAADAHFRDITGRTIASVEVVLRSLSTLTDTASLAFRGGSPPESRQELRRDIRSFKAMLDANDLLMSVYLGYADGGFHQLIALRGSPALKDKYSAPADAAYVDRVISRTGKGEGLQTWRFLDERMGEIGVRTDSPSDFDPRTRPWYEKAAAQPGHVFTDPYVFSSSRLPGLTCARSLPDGAGVFGADITLTQLGDLLAAQQVSPNGVIWVVEANGLLVAFPGLSWEKTVGDDFRLPLALDSPQPVVRAVSEEGSRRSAREGRFFLDVGGQTYLASQTRVEGRDGPGFSIALAAPMRDITGHIDQMAFRVVFMAAGILLLVIPASVVLARGVSRSVGGLIREAAKIQRFDFSPSKPVLSSLSEVQELARACEVMKGTIQSRTDSLKQTQEKLEMLVTEGLALSTEKDLKALITLIFGTAQNLAGSDGGVLYLMEEDRLEVELVSLGSESVVLGGLSATPAPRVMVQPRIMTFLSHDSVLRPACEALVSARPVLNGKGEWSLFPTGLPEEPTHYRISSIISVPIVTRRDEVLGVIQLFNPGDLDDGGETERFIGALAAQAAVTLDNRNLVDSLRGIFDALIQVLASSIDAKSPYTGGHCTRVPALARMLARAAHETQDGPLKSFHIDSEEDWRQLWIASWLHDCGKVTTPEFVVDKATKLETIYNRIHEVRMRFEVLRRDAEIDHLRRLAGGREDASALEEELRRTHRELEEDFEFVARCNEGGEFMPQEAMDRIRAIGARTWTRHYSDRLGISTEELKNRGDALEPALPVEEPLLSDRPEHVIPRTKDYSHLRDISGNPVVVPANEYNRGEVYNLCIARGTLTHEERFKINEHMLSGLEMLAKIPFPKSLGRVPEIAMAHHETLTGTGYPLRKRKEQLSVESRILAVADVFEALTASDRPYKKAKPLSEAVRIMSFMRNDQHIDPDIFDVFLREGVYKSYAEQYLSPDQIDTVDVAAYLGRPAHNPA